MFGIINRIRDIWHSEMIIREMAQKEARIDPDSLPDFLRLQYYSRDVRDAVRKASRLLEIEKPRIVYVPYMSDYRVFMMSDKLPKVPLGNFVGGYYEHEFNVIYLALYDVAHEIRTGQVGERSAQELAFTALHELRHAYQKRHEEDVYYSSGNAVGVKAHINDASEVDADAFAAAFFLNNISSNLEDAGEAYTVLFNIDKGRRARRAHEICKQYDWTKLLVVRGYIPEETMKFLSPEQFKELGM